jgi:hypothetical protein
LTPLTWKELTTWRSSWRSCSKTFLTTLKTTLKTTTGTTGSKATAWTPTPWKAIGTQEATITVDTMAAIAQPTMTTTTRKKMMLKWRR